MAPKHRVIIDTDPGVDDVLALLLALSSAPEELEVAMISVTYGNVPLQSCLRNVMTLFHVLDREFEWRKANGKDVGFGSLLQGPNKPIVAVGAEHPLAEEILMADYFHGIDGLHGVHEIHPHLSPADTWKALFDACATASTPSTPPVPWSSHFTPSKQPAHLEMLRLLRESPENTVTIVTIGPMTNVALAAAEDPAAFLRAREVVVMGGAIDVEGNVTPVGEFNCYADAVAAARVYALTSPTPSSTMPVTPPPSASASSSACLVVKDYPPDKDLVATSKEPLNLTLVPLDITTPHILTRSSFSRWTDPLVDQGSPLATWTSHFVTKTFDHIDEMLGDGNEAELSLHDPLTIWYLLTRDDPGWQTPAKPEDIRIETTGQWTRGMHVVDRRQRAKPAELVALATLSDDDIATIDQVPGDTMGWLSVRKGNRIRRLTRSPGELLCAEDVMNRIFGAVE